MQKAIAPFLILMAASLLSTAQQNNPGIVKIRGTKLTYPLVEKWINEFSKEYPHIKVSIAATAPADSIDFTIASYALTSTDLDANQASAVVSRYVQLPVANSKRPDLATLQSTGITEKNLRNLFFSPSTPTFLPSAQTPTLYIRDRPVCAVKAFADHFGDNPKEIKGTGIKGDDSDLADAVRNDINGLSFNNLGFIYDSKTRKISDGLAVIPLDLNENGKIDKEEQIYGTLDSVIEFIEKTHHPKFITENVNFIFKKNSTNTNAGIFLYWVLTTGQQYHHQLGFVSVDKTLISEERTIISSAFNLNAASCETTNDLMKKRKSNKPN
ncbi:MAG: hypothetical protein JNM57_16795 [Cyclobacteriaceae bacterium]|nr:hypothetical protein [Cyclobacteriaceae bacterium]